MKPLLSIVVPTRNRYIYLNHIVDYFSNIKSNNIELVIHDNSDIEDAKKYEEFIYEFEDKRIKYFYNPSNLSQKENCDLAIFHASGEWVTMIGDDDLFSEHIINYCNDWNSNGIEAVLPNKAIYTWPDVNPKFYKSSMKGALITQEYSGKIKDIDTKKLLKNVLSIGGSEILDLPRVYHGIVKKSVLNKIYNDCGSYNPGPSPDIANAVALCNYLTSAISIDLPLIISGQCNVSAGGMGAQGNHYGDIDKINQLPDNTASMWNKEIPFYWSGKTIYAESVLQSISAIKQNYLKKNFNYNYLYSSLLVFDGGTQYRGRIIKSIRNNKKSNLIKILMYFIFIWGKRINFHIKNNLTLIFRNKKNSKNIIYNYADITKVSVKIDELIKENEKT